MKEFKLVLLGLLCWPLLSSAGDVNVLYVGGLAPFSQGLDVRENIKAECALEQLVADHIAHRAKRAYSKVVRKKPTAGAFHVLSIEIINVFGAGGGLWSGPKNLEIEGILKDHQDRPVGSFRAERFSMGGGLFPALQGTCQILRRISKQLAKDVAKFLVSPTDGAVMGNWP